MIDLAFYARCLAITLAVEITVALALFGVRGGRGWLAWDVGCVNLLTHPLAFLARVALGAPFAVVEAIVPVVEAAGLRAAGRPPVHAVGIAVLGNAATVALSFVVT